MTNHNKYEELIPVYSIGALDGDELEELENHLSGGCDSCRQLLLENKRIASLIPYSISEAPPSVDLERKLMDRISGDKPLEEPRGLFDFLENIRPVWYGLGSAVVAIVLVVLFISNINLRNVVNDKNTIVKSLSSELNEKNDALVVLRSQLENKDQKIEDLQLVATRSAELAAFLQDPDVVIINLVSLVPDLKAVGRVLWNSNEDKAIFYSSNLPLTPPEKTYQLWVIAGDTPKSVGMFDVGQKGMNIIKIDSLSEIKNIQKYAVTLEPVGGVPLPTGEMYLAGDL